jgi:hypothetical protein
MRPISGSLRYAYTAAAAKLRSENKKVTIRSLSDEMGEAFKAVQRYIYRNEDVAREIGVEVEHIKHGVLDYTGAILSIPADVRPTLRRIASALGIDYSSVGKFLKAHPELRALHPRFELADTVTEEKEAEEIEEEVPVMSTWSDLYVVVWSERSGRYVGQVVNREQYLECWEKKLLKHLNEGLEKPPHLPTPEQVAEMD